MKFRTRPAIASVTVAVALVFASFAAIAQQPLDRSKIPPPGKPPDLRVPVWIRYSLTNGADLIVSEKRDLPLVSFRITIQGGASQMESSNRRGLASLTASMMSEGTKTRNGEAISNAQQLLGTSININIANENGSLAFQSTTSKFPQALDVLADMLLNSTFPPDALERLRAQRLVALTQARDQPAAIATRVFAKILYGDLHPFGQNVMEESLKAITRDDITAFHKVYFRPGRALITVVGDVNPSSAKAMIEKSLAGWTRGGEKPAFSYPALPSPHPMTIFLVDKPGAAQSTFAIGNPGPPRNTPDYDALQVMNTILGGMFQSRLNANIREEKGYSYSVNSNFGYGKGPGAFRAGGDMVSAKTDTALVEFMKELRGIGGARPVTDDELKTAKDSLIQRLPGTFESVQSVNNAIVSLWTLGLPDSYYQQYISRISAVKKEDVVRVAKQYIDIEHLTIVIVGDRASIEAPLRATGIAPIALTDIEGKALQGYR
jgi:zinc protease